MKRSLLTAAALIAFGIVLAGCGGSSESSTAGESEGQQATIAGVSANDHGTKQVSDETELELDDYYFEPTVVEGKPGSQVKLELENESKMEHNFSIVSQGIDQDVEAGESATVTVRIPSSGEISFYCKYHKGEGMAGALKASGTSGAGGGMTTEQTSTSSSGY
jgi:plastocyanin